MKLTRRSILLASSTLASSSWATAPLRNGEVLPDPPFDALREVAPFVMGVRPHRTGGVRLELEPAPLGSKRLIHNYGHGGGGITLSWGCASLVKDLVDGLSKQLGHPPSVAVIGTGVIGLTSATELRRSFPTMSLAVYAKSLDVKATTSFIAGGQFEPSGISLEYATSGAKAVLAEYLRRSKTRIVELQNSGQRQRFGVAERKNYTLDHLVRAFDEFTPLDVVGKPKRGALPFAKLKVPGREYSNWLMNPMLLLPTLAADLTETKVRFIERTFSSRDELATVPEEVVINCTGLGAKALLKDEAMVPQRGHLVVLQKTDPKHFYFFSGGCENRVTSYAFCRQDDVIIGGSVQANVDSLERTPDDEAMFAKLVSNARGLFGGTVQCTR